MIAVETYEVEEIKSEIGNLAADAEAIELAQKLGLEGQLSLSNQETFTRNPYRVLTAQENLVFTTLFPQVTTAEKYSSGIIPLRALQVIAHAKECGLFHHVEIWGPADAREKDPVAIARTHADSWQGKSFLLARWGDPLCTFEQLVEKAKKLWIAKMEAEMRTAQAEIATRLQLLQAKANEAFLTGSAPTFTCYGSGW